MTSVFGGMRSSDKSQRCSCRQSTTSRLAATSEAGIGSLGVRRRTRTSSCPVRVPSSPKSITPPPTIPSPIQLRASPYVGTDATRDRLAMRSPATNLRPLWSLEKLENSTNVRGGK